MQETDSFNILGSGAFSDFVWLFGIKRSKSHGLVDFLGTGVEDEAGCEPPPPPQRRSPAAPEWDYSWVGFANPPGLLRWENGSREAPLRAGRGGGFCAEEEDLRWLRWPGASCTRLEGGLWPSGEGPRGQGALTHPEEGWRGCKNPKGKSPAGCRPMSGGKEE